MRSVHGQGVRREWVRRGGGDRDGGGGRGIWLGLMLACLLLAACGKSHAPPLTEPQNMDPWSPYLGFHTSGLVSRKTAIRIGFLVEVATPEEVGKDAATALRIEPPIKGALTYVSTREISLVPEQELTPGQVYSFSLLADKLAGVPDDLQPYRFSINVMRQAFAITLENLQSVAGAPKMFNVTGNLSTADMADDKAVEAMLQASYLGKAQTLVWQHNPNMRQHEFKIMNLPRQQETGELLLSYNGERIGVSDSGEQKIAIPAVGQFTVAHVRPITQDRQYVLVELSDPLSASQDLKGLVSLEGVSSTLQVDGNSLRIYPDGALQGEVKVILEAGLRNRQGKPLGQRVEQQVFFSSLQPQVRFVGEGVVLPSNPVLSIPFEAMNVHSVQVTAFRIYDNNIGSFLQQNKLGGDYNLLTVGRYLWRKTIALPNPQIDKWTRYELDAGELLRSSPGSLFQLTLSINRGNALLSCSEGDVAVPVVKEPPPQDLEDADVSQNSGWDFAEQYYGNDYSQLWKDRADPCKDAFYDYAETTKAHRNFMTSNIGLIAKRNDRNDLRIIVTDLRSAKPLPGAKLRLFNYQNQEIGEAVSDGDGFAALTTRNTPFYLLAQKGDDRAYLKLNAGSKLATSHFDVGGEAISGGIKGYVYGERGVWRPGDDIFLTFVLFDKDERIPASHPVTMQLYNPRGQLMQSQTNAQPVDDFYAFKMRTADDAPTGDWEARALIGGATFSRKLKIETVKPNRLKIEMELGGERLALSQMPAKGSLFAQWLHGATAADLKAEVRVRLRPVATAFTTFTDYSFDDPAREFSGEEQVIFDGQLGKDGKVAFNANIEAARASAPGRLKALFDLKVFEPGGDFSISASSKELDPFDVYVGVKPPQGDAARNMLLTDTRHKVAVASVDAAGKPVSRAKVRMRIYKLDWKWWWDKSGESLAQYASADFSSALQEGEIATHDGRGEWEFEIKYPDWGRYLIRACDLEGEHCSGRIVYIDWPGWAGRAKEQSGDGAAALSFFTDKTEYTVGEQAVVQLPEATVGRALLTVESASRILRQEWLEFVAGKPAQVTLPITREMSPNVYVSISLLQPHSGRDNDRPLRMYGITPLTVRDPATHLQPLLSAAQEWRPNQPVSFQVRESAGKAMSYTVAVVDEGLLGLTAFRTPDLHQQFYRKEALGIDTWDLFDEVAGAYSGRLENLLALGGSDAAANDDSARQKRRFPPVVRFLGPFQLAAGKTATHNLSLPQYLGAVRLMLVAGHQGAYGSAEQSVFVREPLSLLATVPRVLGPGETVTVPVNLFVMDDSIHEVQVKIDADDFFVPGGQPPAVVHFDKAGDKMAFVTLKVADKVGKGHLRVSAQGGKFTSETEVYLDIRSANARSTRLTRAALQPGEQWAADIVPHGLPGTNQVLLETSVAPPLGLQDRLQYLIQYPHGCVEQVTSAVFPQLYLDRLLRLDQTDKDKVDEHVHAGIERLRQFQLTSGAFSYWPGQQELNEWATNYAGHFLLEARAKGYQVPAEMLQPWLNYQQTRAEAWLAGSGESQQNQVYRLYTLALAGQAAVAAMNRLREAPQMSNAARWQLAAAYHLAGLGDAAADLTRGRDLSVRAQEVDEDTFGSVLRDQALILESLATQKRLSEGKALADEIAQALAAQRWYSTQSIAYSLLAMSRFLGSQQAAGEFTYSLSRNGAAPAAVKAEGVIQQQTLANFAAKGEKLELRNTGKSPLFVTVYSSGVPKAGDEVDAANGLALEVRYVNDAGAPVAVEKLTQGTQLTALLTVRNTSSHALRNLALTQIVPSGWEIHNERLAGADDAAAGYDYQDVRDDRVLTYFSLGSGDSRTFKVRLTATYPGSYYLPGVQVEAMYEADKSAHSRGRWLDVVRAR